MPPHEETLPAGKTCRLPGPFTPCDPAELEPLLRRLRDNTPIPGPQTFPRGTLLADGRLDLCKQDLGPGGARAVAAALRHNTRVRHLLLGADGLGTEGARAVAELVRDSPAL